MFTMRCTRIFLTIATFTLVVISFTTAVRGQGPYSVMDKVTLGAEKGTDFLPANNFLSGNVSTFTGQFQYGIPVVTLKGRSGSKLTFSIQYSSAESKKKANLSNKYYQPSWVGFGWQGGFGYIASDRNNTFDYKDDEYTMVDEAGHSFRLLPHQTTAHRFVVEEFRNWIIDRTIGASGEVTHWTVIREDGRKFTYGNPDSLATRHSLRIGNNAANPSGAIASYEENPYQWDLYSIADASGNNAFILSYQQDSTYIVYGANTSVRAYTQASYLKRVTAPDGRYLEFVLEDREDFENVWAAWHHDFFMTKRLASVTRRAADTTIIEKAIFQYNYLNSTEDSTRKKSILTSVQMKSGDESEAYPAYLFNYEIEPDSGHFGAMTSVIDPVGTIKELVYVTESTYSDSRLHSGAAIYEGLDPNNYDLQLRTTSFTDNIAVFVFTSKYLSNPREDFVRVLYWNGMWHQLTTDQIGLSTYPGKEILVGTGRDYAVITQHRDESDTSDVDSLIFLNLVDGYLVRSADTLPSGFELTFQAPYDDENITCPKPDISIEAGPDFFVLRLRGQGQCDYELHQISFVFSYHWNGVKWLNQDAVWEEFSYSGPFDTYTLQESDLSSRSFIQRTFLQWVDNGVPYNKSQVLAGVRHDGQIRKFSSNWYSISGQSGATLKNVAINPPYLAYFRRRSDFTDYAYLEVSELNSSGVWVDAGGLSTFDRLLWNEIKSLVLKKNYLAWKLSGSGTTELMTMYKDDTGWVPNPFIPLGNHTIIDIQYNDHTIAVCGRSWGSQNRFVDLYTWDGSSWIKKDVFDYNEQDPEKISIRLSNNTLAISVRDNPVFNVTRRDLVWVSRFEGTNVNNEYWSDTVRVFDNTYDIAPDRLKYFVQDNRLMLFDRLDWSTDEFTIRLFDYFDGQWNETILDVTGHHDGLPTLYGMGLSRNNYFYATYGEVTGIGTYSVTIFQTGHSYMGQHEGLASHTLVDTVKLIEWSDDADTVFVNYDYANVIKDPTDNYPKVNITSVSQIHRKGETEYLTKYHHYNDFPTAETGNLEDPAIYGTTGGGYMMDGLTYKIESENEAGGFTTDYTNRVYKVDSLGNGVYWSHLDSEVTAVDGIERTVSYEYSGDKFHQLVKTKTSVPGRLGTAYEISDSIKYAYEFHTLMKNDNAVSQPGEIIKLEGLTVLNKDILSYAKQSHWQVSQQSTWLDLEAETIVKNQTELWDNSGNVIQYIDALGVSTSIIFDDNEFHTVAVISGASRSDCVHLGFEQEDGWDGWNYRLYFASTDTTSAESFTGNICIELIDDTSNSDKAWGPFRSIDADSLTDSLYHVSAWYKGNNPCFVYVWTFDGNNVLRQYHVLQYTPDTPVESVEWVHLDTVFSIPHQFGDGDTLNHIEILLGSLNGTFDTNYAYIDDIRFHAANALMTSRTYDKITGLITSVSNENNVPIKFEYDDLQRLIKQRDHTGALLEEKEYFYSRDYTGLPAEAPKNPSYALTRTYRGISEFGERVEFYDNFGKPVQTRLTHESATLVSGKQYDSRGRDSTNYKPYYDTGLNSSVLDFDLISNLETEVEGYYASYIPDLDTFTYKEFIYEASSKNRLLEIRHEGKFNEFPNTFSYGLNSVTIDDYDASTLYKTDNFDPDNNQQTSYVDRLGRTIRTVSDPASINAYTSFYPNYQGLDTLVIQPEGHKIKKIYNNQGWLVFDSSGDYGVDKSIYDKVGNLRFSRTATDYASNRFHFYKYDAHNRLIEEGVFTDTIAMTWTNSKISSFPDTNTVDSLNTVITASYEYDNGEYANGRLTKSIRYPSGDADSASWESYEYDFRSRVVRKELFIYPLDEYTGPRIFTAGYNYADQLTQLTYPNGESVYYSYNLAGQAAIVTDYGTMRAHHIYWPSGKLAAKALGDLAQAQLVTYTYNERDWLTAINDGIVDTSSTGNGDHYSLELTYDSAAYEGDCEGESCDYDSGYHNGNIASYTVKTSPGTGNNAVTYRLAYDDMDRMVAEFYVESATSYGYTYSYDKNGNISIIADEPFVFPTINLNRYFYYSGTNRVEQITNLAAGFNNFEFTPSGSMKKDNSTDHFLSYNLHGHLSKRARIFTEASMDVKFWYNTEGQRILKKYKHYIYVCQGDGDPGQLSFGSVINSSLGPGGGGNCFNWSTDFTAYYYFGGQVQSEYFNGGLTELSGNYVYLNGERVAKMAGSANSVRYYLNDHLGSVVATVDKDGTLKNWYQHEPYGKPHRMFAADDIDFGFNGHLLDEELQHDIYYYGARYYDPEYKIFTSVDPLSDLYSGWGPYVYTLSNPMKYVDPDGRCPTCPDEVYVPIAQHVYGAEEGQVTENGWRVIRVDDLRSGFQGALYEGTYEGNTEYIYATAGTQGLFDIAADILQLAGVSKQYIESVLKADILDLRFPGVSFTGHSLGGGLASANALSVEGKAVTFNAAGLSYFTKFALGITDNSAKISAYVVEGDIVHILQSIIGLKAEGDITYLSASYSSFSLWEPPLATIIKRALESAENHRITTLVHKFDQSFENK